MKNATHTDQKHSGREADLPTAIFSATQQAILTTYTHNLLINSIMLGIKTLEML